MALITCPECGREVSDRASACPHCGCPLTKAPEYAPFCLQRESKFYFCAVVYEVYLDYQRWGTLSNGERLKTELTYGTHHLRMLDLNNRKKVVYENDFTIGRGGLTFTFSAAMKPTLQASSKLAPPDPEPVRSAAGEPAAPVQIATPVQTQPQIISRDNGGMRCPKCGGTMQVQTVTESRKTGCFTVLLYLLLAVTIMGLLIVIPLMLRKKTETVSYAVCQNCGYRKRLK